MTKKKPAKRITLQKTDLQQLRSFYPKGTVLFNEKDAQDCAYIIEKGEIELSAMKDGKQTSLTRLGAGEVLGETALFGVGKRTSTAIATEDCEVFRIFPDLLHDRIMQMDPLVGLLISMLVNRYRQWRDPSAPEDPSAQQPRENLLQREKTNNFLHDLDTQRGVALKELRMAQEIIEAIAKEELVPYLQPIISLQDMKLNGFEMLVRWNHPTAGPMLPVDFVPVAERTNIIWHLDLMMLERACKIAKDVQAAAGTERKIYLSVNLSGVHFVSEEFASQITDIIRDSGVDPAQIVLEITESALIGGTDIVEKILRNFKKFGLTIMLDDFGTGYSSLSYLHRFSIDRLKIDQSFVNDIHNKKSRSFDVIRAIVFLAKSFGLSLVAEGIDSKEDVETLASLGCEAGQGYLFSKPLPVSEALNFVKESVAKNG